MTEENDADILAELEGRKSLLDMAGMKMDLEDALNRKVDLLTCKVPSPGEIKCFLK